MKRLNQAQIAKELGISKSYLSMILSGQRKCPPELIEKLQSIPGVHKVVNNQLWTRTGSQKVVGSNPISSTNHKFSTPKDPELF
jgi:transcriptional regulator with XRE-family HTH domain